MSLAFSLLAAAVVIVALVLYRIYPADLPHKENPGFIDIIFESPLVVFATRAILLSLAAVLAFAGLFTVGSIVSWMKRRQWLTKAGPFEVAREAVDTLIAQVQYWQQEAITQNREVQELRERLEQTAALLNEVLADDDATAGDA